MIHAEERRVPLARSGNAAVDGVVRVRRLGVLHHGKGFTLEQREPVAVIMTLSGRQERSALPTGRAAGSALVFLAIPAAACLVTKILTWHTRRIT